MLGLRVGAERAGVLPTKAGEPSGREGAGRAAVVGCGQEPDSVSFRGRLYRVQLLPPNCLGPLCCGSWAAGELSSGPRGPLHPGVQAEPNGPPVLVVASGLTVWHADELKTVAQISRNE